MKLSLKFIRVLCAIMCFVFLTSMNIDSAVNINSIILSEYGNTERYEIVESAETRGMFWLYDFITLKTPNGTDVDAKKYLRSLSDEQIAYSNEFFTSTYPDAQLIHSASAAYNCHSYAWYKNSNDNEYIIDYPHPYFLDDSYVLVESPRPGDIVCYYNVYMDIIHSGIVCEVDAGYSNGVCGTSNLLWVESKWGEAGVFYHRGDQCPYTTSGHEYENSSDSARNTLFASQIRFYRPRVDDVKYLGIEGNEYTIDKNIVSDGEIKDTYSMYELNITHSGYYDFEISSENDIEILLYDIHMQKIDTIADNIVNNTYTYRLNLDIGKYYLRSSFLSKEDTGLITVNVESHSDHEYEYVIVSDFYHILKCDCGATSGIQEGHIYTGSGLIGYVKCIQCGFLKYVGNTTIPIIKGKIPTIEAICKE